MKAGDNRIREIFAGWKALNDYDVDEAARHAGFPSYRTMKRRLVEITRATDEDIIRMVTGRRTR